MKKVVKSKVTKLKISKRRTAERELGAPYFSVSTFSDIKDLPVNLKKVTAVANEVLTLLDNEHLPKFVREISITFITDKEMKELNGHFRNKDKTTDVLSFSMIEGLTDKFADEASLGRHLGDIVISHKKAFKQCHKYGTTPNQEIIRLVTHGILHLFGYDHENVSEFEASKMRTIEGLVFEVVKGRRVLV